MYQVQVEVFKLQTFKAPVQSTFHVVFLSMPKFGSNEEIFALYAFSEAILQCFSDFFFVAIKLCTIDVSVTIDEDCLFDNF